VDGRVFEIEVLAAGDSTSVRVDGTEMEAELRPLGPRGAYALRLGGAVRTVVVAEGDGELSVQVGAGAHRVVVEDERERAAHAVRPPRADGPRVLRSVMPGIVREVLVAAGASVAAKAPLLVLEAMKMLNEVRADRAGTVRQVHVAPGTTVVKGDALVTLEG